MFKFYECGVFEVSGEKETLSVEHSVVLVDGQSVEISVIAPTSASKISVYRSTVSDDEKHILDVFIPSSLKNSPELSATFTLKDAGNTSPSLVPYPLTTTLTSDESKAFPTPEFSLLAKGGGDFSAGEYFYRLTITSSTGKHPAFVDKDVVVKYFKPTFDAAMVFSKEDLSTITAFTHIPDPFSYISTFGNELSLENVSVNNRPLVLQKLRVGNEFISRYVAPITPVIIFVSETRVLVDQPVLLTLSPPDVEIQVIEGAITGPTEMLKGVMVKTFPEPGSVSYYPSPASKFLFSISGGNFKVIS